MKAPKSINNLAAEELAEALNKLWMHYEDLGKSNPGFLGKLSLQDYALFADAMTAAPTALLAAGYTDSVD